MKILRYTFASLCLATLLLVTSSKALADPFSVTISVDENGHGLLTNTSGFNGALPASMSPDPGPGGLASALTYGLLSPPGLVIGDVLIFDQGSLLSDIVRFNPDGTMVFYSENLSGVTALADTGFPLGLYTNTFVGFEVNGFFTYTPIAGQPGFVAGSSGPVTYNINSSPVPEPATMLLLGTGLAGIAAKVRKRRPNST